MSFIKRMKGFMLASSRFMNFEKKASISLLDDIFFSISELRYCSEHDGKKNMGKDFYNLELDFKKSTEQAKVKVNNGKATTSK